MPTQDVNFTTGPALLLDVGTLSYNGCVFSPLFETKVSSKPVEDNAKRTIKQIDHSITVEGYVTLPAGAADISNTMKTLYSLLNKQGGKLVYKGRALDIVADGRSDLAWGPVPEILEFQPLGAGRSAKISWKVTTRLPPPAVTNLLLGLGVIQLNYDTSVAYDEAGYSSISIKGTLERELFERFKGKDDRTVGSTVDQYRHYLENRILKGIDLGRFHITNRSFDISRDKRTMEFNFAASEKPYMDLPPNCTVARGSYSVRQEKQGLGVVKWLCTLRATYTVRADKPRKQAYWAFLTLMFLRMQQTLVTEPISETNQKNPNIPLGIAGQGLDFSFNLKDQIIKTKTTKKPSTRPWLIDFSMDEGLYQDSKTVSFSATWRLLSRLSDIILTSGMWRKVPDGGKKPGNNLWAASVVDVMGSKSWLKNELDPKLDIIIDLGSASV